MPKKTKQKQNKHPIHYLVTISRTVANNIFSNLLKKLELTLKIKVFLLFRHVGWTWTDPDLHKTQKS